MSAFYDNHITDLGRILLGDIQMGASFVPTKIVIGKGYMPQGKTTQTMTDVVDVVKELPLNKAIKNPDGDAIFGTVFTNEDIQQSFYYRELALYAKGVYFNQSGETERETDEILYSYGNAGDTAELIPAYSTGNVVERQLDLIVYIGNDAEVHLKMETGIYVTIPVFNDIVEQIDKRINAVWDTIQVIDEQVKQNAEDIQKIKAQGAGGIPPQIIVTSKNGSTVTCTKDETTLEQISSGTVTFDLDSYGTWHVTATLDGVPIETDVLVDDVKQYKISLIGIVATVHVTTSSGAVVTATNGTLTLGGLGSTSFELLQSGDWVFTAKLDDTIVSSPLVVEVGSTYQVDLRMLQEIRLLSNPNKTDYLTNEEFDKTGLVVSAVFKDGTVEDVTNQCSFIPNVMTFDTSIVTVNFTLNGISKTLDIPVTVSKRQGNLSLNKSNLNLSETMRTDTILVDTENTGDIVAISSDISVATVTVIEKTVTVTLVNPGVTTISVYAKEDNTYLQTNSVKCTVTVAKYASTISVSPTSLSLTASAKTKNITVTTNSTGTVIAKSNNSSIATVSVSGKTVKVTGVKSGSTSISIYVAEDETYVQTITKTISINVQLLPEKRPLEEMSWAEIRQVSDAGLASSYWSVGDTKTITLNGTVGARTFSNYQMQAFILGFDHNASREGTKRIHFCIGKQNGKNYNVAFCDKYGNQNYSGEDCFCMNKTATTVGGWKDSFMRNTIMTQFRNVLPSDLKSNMKTVTKYSNNTSVTSTSDFTATTDYMFIMSGAEMGYTPTGYEATYQKQYDYYVAGNAKLFSADDTSISSPNHTWTKTVIGYSNFEGSFSESVNGATGVSASSSKKVAPCFCV